MCRSVWSLIGLDYFCHTTLMSVSICMRVTKYRAAVICMHVCVCVCVCVRTCMRACVRACIFESDEGGHTGCRSEGR